MSTEYLYLNELPLEQKLKIFIKEYMEESYLPWLWLLCELVEKDNTSAFDIKVIQWANHLLEKINLTCENLYENRKKKICQPILNALIDIFKNNSYFVPSDKIIHSFTQKLKNDFSFKDEIKLDYDKLFLINKTLLQKTLKDKWIYSEDNKEIQKNINNYLKNIILPRFNSSAFVNNFSSPLFIIIPQLPIAHNGEGIGADFNEDRIKILRNTSFNGMEDANKISYYSPRISNLQLAISYTPDSSKSYLSTSVFNNKNWRVLDITTLNANYLNYLENDLSYELSASLENGRSKNNYQNNTKKRNLLAFDFGTTANYFGFTLASNIGFWGNSLQNKNNNCDIANLNLNLQNQDNLCP